MSHLLHELNSLFQVNVKSFEMNVQLCDILNIYLFICFQVMNNP